MVSAGGERVRFEAPLECNGPVEEWLDSLVLVAQDALRRCYI